MAANATDAAATIAGFVDVAGVHTYYEVEGAGEPLVLLHGGFSPIESWSGQRPGLVERYRVWLPERRGHGRTPDVEGPSGYRLMAHDTIGFLEAMAIGPARIVGYSDGGNVALELALLRPDLVKRLVVMGAVADLSGLTPMYRELSRSMRPEDLPPSIHEAYAALSPDGAAHFPVVFQKLLEVWRTEPVHDLAELAAITAPTLVLVSDDDVVTLEHAIAVVRALPDAQLGVVPGTSHTMVFEKPDLVTRLLLDFLDDQQVPRLMPGH